jgi:6-pyruvoyl-tetrahydropterin synthase
VKVGVRFGVVVLSAVKLVCLRQSKTEHLTSGLWVKCIYTCCTLLDHVQVRNATFLPRLRDYCFRVSRQLVGHQYKLNIHVSKFLLNPEFVEAKNFVKHFLTLIHFCFILWKLNFNKSLPLYYSVGLYRLKAKFKCFSKANIWSYMQAISF